MLLLKNNKVKLIWLISDVSMKGSGPVFFGTNNWAIDKNINISAKVLVMGHSYVRRLGKEVNQ